MGSSITDKLIVVRGFSEDYYKETRDLNHIKEVEDDYNKRFNLKSLGLELNFLSNRYNQGIKNIQKSIEIL
ncbi:MAG: hypothetical protein E2O29_03560 [Deltaproteobacteria bacterium]|nr:MAG: hypothetical protein E2O29_03560 [Deltaproteobacteria bacterium]